MKESKFSMFQANVIVTTQKWLNSILGRGWVHVWTPVWALGEKDRGSLVTNVEVMEEDIIKVLGKECRESGLENTGIWGEKRRRVCEREHTKARAIQCLQEDQVPKKDCSGVRIL